VVAAAHTLAKRRGVRLSLAGGVVRDLLLGNPVRDVDLVLEGDGPAFAKELAGAVKASVRVHDRFGTSVLTLPNGERVDVATARRETYASPGALPAVTFPATLAEDLARRDFTVNAMALELSPGRRLVDPFGGVRDLARRTLRVLHPASFADDPTRALRAVRYANRYGFRIDAETRRAIARAVASGAFDHVSGDRVRRELVKIFAEPGRAAAIRRLGRLGLDAAIAPELAMTADAVPRLRAAEVLARGYPGAGWLLFLLCWTDGLPERSLRRIADRLSLSGAERDRLLAWPATRRRIGRGLAGSRASEIARRIAALSTDEILAAAAVLPAADRRALLRTIRLSAKTPMLVRGEDLLAAGILPGAAIGAALERTRNALLDGKISSQDALSFALRVAKKEHR
jgi:tRNA nucleotidyltransferase (CCA-adding enzyme)